MVLPCESVMVPIRYCWMIVIVRGRAVVVIWVVVPDVFVDVKRRRHGRRPGEGLNQHNCDKPAHGAQSTTVTGSLLVRLALQ